MKNFKSNAKSLLEWGLFALLGISLGVGGVLALNSWKKGESIAQMTRAGDYRLAFSKEKRAQPIMLVMKGCSYCEDARRWLIANNLSVSEVEIGMDPQINSVLLNERDIGTPTLIFERKLIVGFDPEIWAKAFNK